MLRVGLDPNVLVSALISPAGVPAKVIEAVLDGDIDHIASLRWLSEADGLAVRPCLRRWFGREESEALIERLWVITGLVAFRTAVSFLLSPHQRVPSRTPGLGLIPGTTGAPAGESTPEVLRFGIQFTDGRKATTLDGFPNLDPGETRT